MMATKTQTKTTNKNGQTSTTTTTTETSTTGSSKTQGGSTSTSGAAGVVNPNTQAQFDQSSQPYTPSDRVNQMYNQMNGLQKPADYNSTYEGQLGNLYDKIMNRDPFTFNMNSDQLYKEYKDLYAQQGKRAMQDTIGNAQALSGGYGNSYAQTVGQQAYQAYLAEMDRMLPQFEQMAYKRYQAEGENLMNKYNMANNMDARDYARYLDDVKRYQSDRDFYTGAYMNERNFDYNQYASNRNFWQYEYWKERNSAQMSNSSHWDNTESNSTTTENVTTNISDYGGGSSAKAKTGKTSDFNVASYPAYNQGVVGSNTGNGTVRDYSADLQYKLGIKPNNGDINMNALNGGEYKSVNDNNLSYLAWGTRDYDVNMQQKAKDEAAGKSGTLIQETSNYQPKTQQQAMDQRRVNDILSAATNAKDYEQYVYDQYQKGNLKESEAVGILNSLRWR